MLPSVFSLRSGQGTMFSIFRVSRWKQRAGPCYSPLLYNDLREDHIVFWAKWSFLLNSSAIFLETCFLSLQGCFLGTELVEPATPWCPPFFKKYFLRWCKLLVIFHSSDKILPDILCLFFSVLLEGGIIGVYGTLDSGVWGHHFRFPSREATSIMCQCV